MRENRIWVSHTIFGMSHDPLGGRMCSSPKLTLQVYPKWHPVGPEDLKAMAARQLQRRTSEIDFGDISNPTASVNTKGRGPEVKFG